MLTTVQWIFIFHLFEDTWRKRTLTEAIDNGVLEKGEIVKLCNDFGNLYCSWLTNVSRTFSTARLLCILYQQWARGSIYTCASSIVKRFRACLLKRAFFFFFFFFYIEINLFLGYFQTEYSKLYLTSILHSVLMLWYFCWSCYVAYIVHWILWNKILLDKGWEGSKEKKSQKKNVSRDRPVFMKFCYSSLRVKFFEAESSIPRGNLESCFVIVCHRHFYI